MKHLTPVKIPWQKDDTVFFPFHSMVSTLSIRNFTIPVTTKLLSAYALKLDKTKILPSFKDLISFIRKES